MIFANVSTVLSAAVDDERIAWNPCEAGSVTSPKRDTGKVTPWETECVAAVRKAIPDQWRITLELGVGLGLRQGEIFGLSPDDVDFLRGTVEVRRQVKVLGGNKLLFGLPKGNKTRTVPLPSAVRDLLAAYLAGRPGRPVTLPWGALDGEPTTSTLILTTRERKALNRNYFNTYIWKPALVAADVEPSRENGMHALRHHYASVLLDAGENIKAVSDYLGHADAVFTLRTYTHLMPSSSERNRKAVDEAFGCYTGVRSGSESSAL